MDGPTITVVCFSALSGVGLIALAYLLKQVGRLYETERTATERLRVAGRAAADTAGGRGARPGRPLSDLLGRVIEQGASRWAATDAASPIRPRGARSWVAGGDGRRRTRVALVGSAADAPSARRCAATPEPAPFRGTGRRRAARRAAAGAQRGLRRARARPTASERDSPTSTCAWRRLRRPGRAGDRERAAARRDRPERRGGRALAAGARPARLRDSVAVRRQPQGRGDRRRWRPASDEARRNVEDVERLARGAWRRSARCSWRCAPTPWPTRRCPLLEQLAAATREDRASPCI